MLMDHFKHHIKTTYPDMMHFLTYADNYAVGYFRKQGFSKEITLDRSIWAGYIKDYEGGTIMQCTMLRKVNYLGKPDIVAQQKNAILTKIREMSKSHIAYPGLPQFQDPDAGEVSVDPQDVPGLSECKQMLLCHFSDSLEHRGDWVAAFHGYDVGVPVVEIYPF
jgi:histone acetyltransferase